MKFLNVKNGLVLITNDKNESVIVTKEEAFFYQYNLKGIPKCVPSNLPISEIEIKRLLESL